MSGADGGFEVDKPVVREFAHQSLHRAEAFQQCLAEARQLTLSPDAFGRLPMVSSRVYHAYTSYVSGCEAGIGQAATAMSQIRAGIYTTIAEYKRADTAAEDSAAAVAWEAIQPNQVTSPSEPAS